MRVGSDERGLIGTWFIRIALGFLIGGVILFDLGSIVVNYVGLDSKANEIEISVETLASDDELNIYAFESKNIVREMVEDAGAKLIRYRTLPDGELRIKIRRKARTLVVGYFDPIKSWAVATTQVTAQTE